MRRYIIHHDNQKVPNEALRHPQQVKVCQILDLGYPLDNLKGGEVPKKGKVLLHLYMRSGVGNSNLLEAAKVMIKTVKSCCFRLNVAIAPDITLSWSPGVLSPGAPQTIKVRISHQINRLIIFQCWTP